MYVGLSKAALTNILLTAFLNASGGVDQPAGRVTLLGPASHLLGREVMKLRTSINHEILKYT
jgi:hypothetical protein